MTQLKISVPASAANLGPGFDSLALALGVRNTLEVSTSASGLQIHIQGEGRESLPTDAGNLIARAIWKIFRLADRPAPGLELHAHNQIPIAAGLGSSAAAIIAGLAAGGALTGLSPTRGQLLQLAAEMEGHPDNAAAALFGGLNLVIADAQGYLARQLPLGVSQVILVSPAVELSTAEMRRALPHNVPLQDAVFNLGRTGLLLEALRTGDLQLLRSAMQDRLHQPYRARFIPGFEAACQAALEAGAAGVALSGAGPSLLAFAAAGETDVGEAMQQAFRQHGLEASWRVVPVDREGLIIELA